MMPGTQIGVCEVCMLLDGNDSAKAVTFCGFCQAWICEWCSRNPARRARAAMTKKFQQAQELARRISQ